MKQRRFVFPLLLTALLLAGLLSGCSRLLGRQLREKVASYLSELERTPGTEDHFTLKETPNFESRVSLIGFHVTSETYNQDFLVWIRRDGSEICDDYYTLYLQKDAEEAVCSVLRENAADFAPAASVSLGRIANPAISGHAAKTLKELYALSGNARLLEIHIQAKENGSPDDAQIDRLLLAFQKEGLYSAFFPYLSNSVWFEICPDGFWKNTQSGADSGAYLNRVAYAPAAP